MNFFSPPVCFVSLLTSLIFAIDLVPDPERRSRGHQRTFPPALPHLSPHNFVSTHFPVTFSTKQLSQAFLADETRIMPAHGPPSPSVQPAKRQRQSSVDETSPRDAQVSPAALSVEGTGPVATKPGQSSNFRNVSACNRCRLRKNRCDQRLPSCASCAKAGVPCVGYDPITKKEIPRRYALIPLTCR